MAVSAIAVGDCANTDGAVGCESGRGVGDGAGFVSADDEVGSATSVASVSVRYAGVETASDEQQVSENEAWVSENDGVVMGSVNAEEDLASYPG